MRQCVYAKCHLQCRTPQEHRSNYTRIKAHVAHVNRIEKTCARKSRVNWTALSELNIRSLKAIVLRHVEIEAAIVLR